MGARVRGARLFREGHQSLVPECSPAVEEAPHQLDIVTRAFQGEHRALIQQLLREFREHLGGELTITLLENIGQGVEVHEMDEERILGAITWLKARQSAR